MEDKSRTGDVIVITDPSPELKDFLKNWQETKRLNMEKLRMEIGDILPIKGQKEVDEVEQALIMYRIQKDKTDTESLSVINDILFRINEYHDRLINQNANNQ